MLLEGTVAESVCHGRAVGAFSSELPRDHGDSPGHCDVGDHS